MKFQLPDIDRESLKVFQRNVGSRSEYVKVTALLLLDKGLSLVQISDYLGIDESTIHRYRSSYQTDGVEAYLRTDYQGYWGRLSSIEISALRRELNGNLYTDSKQIIARLQTRFGIEYTRQGMVDLLHRIGFCYKQTKQVPCETDVEAQHEFLKNLAVLLEQTVDNDAVVYFADGVHPTHNTRSTHAWIEKGTEREQLSVSGRDRVNINGVVNAQDPTDVLVVEGKSVNSESTKELYEKIIAANPDAKTIYTISDNARYYRNKELAEWVKTTKITPVFLPPYSPNLNLIERLWKFMRKKIINTSFYRKKEEFRQAVLTFFANIKDYKDELTSLMTLNFHVRKLQSNS
jgi:transposase